LVAGSSASAPATSDPWTPLASLANTQIAAYATTANSYSTSQLLAASGKATVPFYFTQGLDQTDAIQKELGMIKSGVINPSKILSIRKLVGTDDYSRQLKFFGSSTTGVVVKTYANTTEYFAGDIIVSSTRLYVVLIGGTSASTAPSSETGLPVALNTATIAYIGTAAASTQYSKMEPTGADGSATAGTLEFESGKEYSFSVRVRSAQANSISPFGITRGYAATASNVFVNTISGASTTSSVYAPFSALFGLVKNFSTDVMLADFSKVGGLLSVSDATNSSVIIFGYSNLSNALAENISRGVPADGISLNLQNLPTFLSVPAIKGTGGVIFIDVRKFATWNDAMTAITSLSVTATVTTPYPLQGTVVAGKSYTATLYVEGLTQTAWKNNYDITAFPYKWDYARLNGYFLEGPYGQGVAYVTNANTVLPINAGVSTQTPIVYDSTQSGLISIGTIAINPIIATTNPIPAGYVVMSSAGAITTEVKFPNLMKEEVRHIAHQYQSYSSKYKQQFKGVRYNAMVMDPQQEKINSDGPYTLYYIEYAPEVDIAYTSTQQMTNLTIIAVPTSNTGITGYIDNILNGGTIDTTAEGLETAS
jgi:hypothetical protein